MIGKTISHYDILEKLGEGGMGVVYKAEDNKLKRPVALKFLPRDLTRSKEARERFKLEAQAAAALNNPNIVTIHEIDEYDGHIYIAMEYVEGETLREKMPFTIETHDTPFEAFDENKTQKLIQHVQDIPGPRAQPLSPNEIADIAIQVCQGLKATHKLGIVHRDIKPQNILVNRDGIVKILDFGVAKLTRGTNATKEMATVGTIHYMSPDQLTAQDIDHRTDIWSLGVVLYEMATTKLPFSKDNSTQAIMYAIVNDNPVPPTELNEDIPRELERIILKCLRKEREERYQSVEELSEDMVNFKRYLGGGAAELHEKQKRPVRQETERRRVTVISGEISGYNEMIAELDPEEVAAAMSDCFAKLDTIAGKYEGRLDKITANSFMVFYGVPVAVEKAPIKALNTAIEMRNCISQINRKQKLGIPLEAHLGVNTGMVIAGVMGKDDSEYSIIGDAVNLAGQIKEAAGKQQIYVGPLTYKHTRSEFEYKKLKSVPLKGKNKPEAVFELLSKEPVIASRRQRQHRVIDSPIVGRDEELDKLQLYLLKAIDGDGSIINITGNAGTGKSRLINEFIAKNESKKIKILVGRALSIGKNLSFHPIIDILKSWAGIKDDDTSATSIQKLEKAVNETAPNSAPEIFPFIATLMGMHLTGEYAQRIEGIDGEGMEKLIYKNFRELILEASARQPIIFIVENLHWADLSTIELLESLFRLAQDHKILFINAFRPNFKTTGDRITRTIKDRTPDHFFELHLTPLNKKNCETLIKNLLNIKRIPASTLDLVISRSEGNPYFIEEVARSFIDNGIVEIHNGKFKLITDKINSVVVPETINEVIMARIDRLDEEAKSLLKIASVIGRNFLYIILAEVAHDVETIDEILDYLQEVELIQEREESGELEYQFKNTLVQEVVYESILLAKRKKLHIEIANAIELHFSIRLEDFYGTLAYHYSLGEELEKAEDYLIKAGEEALKSAASNEAIAYFQDALRIYLEKSGNEANSEKIAMLYKNIALALYNKGRHGEAVEYFDKVMSHWGEKRPKNKAIAVLLFIIDLLSVIKKLYLSRNKSSRIPTEKENDLFEITYKRGTALSSIDVYRMFMENNRFLSNIHKYNLAKVRNGISIYSSSTALFSYSGISFSIARKMLEYARSYIEAGDSVNMFLYQGWEICLDMLCGKWDRHLEYDEKVIDMSLQSGELFGPTAHCLFAGILRAIKGEFQEAQLYIDKLKETGEVYDNDYTRVLKYLLNARCLLWSRKLYDALEEVGTGLPLATKGQQNPDILTLLGVQAHSRALLQDLDAAEQAIKRGDELEAREKQSSPLDIACFHIGRSFYHVCRLESVVKDGKKKEAIRWGKLARRSLKVALKTSKKYFPGLAEVYRYLGVYQWLTGNQKKALVWWGKSIKLAEKIGARPDLGRGYLEIGRRLLEKGSESREFNGLRPADYLEKARTLFEEMKLGWDLEQLHNVE